MFPKGIRKRITLGFYSLLFCIILITLVMYGIIAEVERKFENVEIIDDLLNTTLEVRRFEKNFFLYGKANDYNDNLLFLGELEKLLTGNVKHLRTVMSKSDYTDLWNQVRSYRENMQMLYNFWTDNTSLFGLRHDKVRLENTIRALGKNLTNIAEKASTEERRIIQKLLATTGNVLLVSTLLFVLLCVIIATMLGRSVVRSLKLLEGHAKIISQGTFTVARVNNVDEEIKSLLIAFNTMSNELKNRQKKLVQSEKLASLGTLLSGVAHELNNPLSNVSSSAQILSEEMDDPDIEFKTRLVNQILEQADRARDIVRSLLEFSRTKEFNMQDVLLKSLIEETRILIRGQMPSQVDIRIDIPDDLTIFADKQRIQQVFLNLIKNAIDAVGDEGTIWLSCRLINPEKENREIEILIEDNGPGIPQEIRDKIFDPFFTTKDVGHGSGLGLYIVHDIIEMHGGTLRVESRPGQGTTFIIWLPQKSGGVR